MRPEKITDLTMNTTQPKVLEATTASFLGKCWEPTKCLGTTKKGISCTNIATIVRHCDFKAVCRKHLAQMPKIEFQASINELPDDVLKLLPGELWLDIFERIPIKECDFLSPIRDDYVNYQCKSCERVYKIL
jgi:hypothetical protein